MSRQLLGVMGGVGPGSTAAFYQTVVRRYAARRGGDQPALLIHSVPMTAAIEAAILGGVTAGAPVDELIGLLAEGVQQLARAGVDGIVMPCNTLQAFLPDLVAAAGLPYLPLVGATVSYIRQHGYARVALICTSAMRALGLYQAELQAQAVACVLPSDAEQAGITQTILDSLHARPDANAPLRPVVRRLESAADALLLGCSDITAFADPGFTSLPVVDAMDVLAEAAVAFLTQ